MDTFWKASAVVLLTVVLGLAVGKREKDLSTVLSIAACCMVASAAVHYIEPVLDLLWELDAVGQLQDGMLGILMKAVGIALVGEVAGLICADAGNGSLGKTLQLLSSAVILYLSVPIFRAFFTLIQEILGAI